MPIVERMREHPERISEPIKRTWPEDWDDRKKGAGCWFCGNRSYFGKPFYVGAVGDAHLEPHPIARGHVIVIFRDRHVADFTSLTAEEAAAFWRDVHAVAGLVEQVFAPCHMNYQLLGNVVPHLHVHVVPRYLDDPAPGKPLAWEPKAITESELNGQLELLTQAARKS
jgi:diadenosine tetraphosphate (Ap4A) HIT family hydrolase